MIRDLEQSVLEILFNDSRTTAAQIAVMTGTTLETICETIDALEKQRVIVHYSPKINWDLTDRERVEAMIEVRVTPQRDEGFDAIAEEIYRFDEVSSVYLMSGAYDLMVTVKAKSMKQLALFVAEKLSTLDHVLSTATHFVLKKYKLEGVIFEERKKDERLVVSP